MATRHAACQTWIALIRISVRSRSENHEEVGCNQTRGHLRPTACLPWIASSFGICVCKKSAHLHLPMPCHESIDGLDVGEQVHHPIKICGSRALPSQHTSHATRFAKYTYLTICILQVCGLDDRQMLVCGSLQAVIAQSHKPVAWRRAGSRGGAL